MTNVFEGISVACCMGPHGCVCDQVERVIRAYQEGRRIIPLTAEQRAWCVREADRAGEGLYRPAELEALSDRNLARAVLYAWAEYCRSQGLL